MSSPIPDPARDHAADIVRAALADPAQRPLVKSFFDEATFTVSHVVRDPGSDVCAIIDSVLDYDPASGRTTHASADALIDYVKSEGLTVQWLLETHAHADHLSAAPYLQEKLGGQLAIGHEILTVQAVFGKIFNEGTDFRRDGSQFDHLFNDGDRFEIGGLKATVLHVPGHTPACLAYVIGDAVFPGDTLFMPDYGTARRGLPCRHARPPHPPRPRPPPPPAPAPVVLRRPAHAPPAPPLSRPPGVAMLPICVWWKRSPGPTHARSSSRAPRSAARPAWPPSARR